MHITIPVILCGGNSSRLWPLCHDLNPKYLLKINKQSILDHTINRAKILTKNNNPIIFITSKPQLNTLTAYLLTHHPELDHHIITEPHKRGTAAAITLTTLFIEKKFGSKPICAIMPSDHIINDDPLFNTAAQAAINLAQAGNIALMGIYPDYPSCEYGYFTTERCTDAIETVKEFIEKPDKESAKILIKKQNIYWNSGTVFAAVSTLKTALAPHINSIDRITTLSAEQIQNCPENLYKNFPKNSFDRLVLEKRTDCKAVPLMAPWKDIGSWNMLWQQLNTLKITTTH